MWWMSFCVNHRQYQRSTGTTDKQTAQEIYNIVMSKIALGQWAPEVKEQQDYTFAELVEKYSAWALGRQKSWQKARRYMVGQLNRFFGAYRLDDISVSLVERYQSELLKRGLAAGGVNRLVGTLKAMITKAVDWEMAGEDVLKRVRKVKNIKGEVKRLRYLTVEESRALIRHCDSVIAPIVITALNTGMRRGEILSLKWDNVDLKHGFILLEVTKNGERREIPINETLRQTLQGLTRRLDIPYVFYDSTTGKPVKDFKNGLLQH